MRVRLLGPVDVIADGALRPLHGSRRKAILATLALHDGVAVSTSRLIDIVWGKPASPAVVNTLHSNLSYLRNALGSKTVILARRPGYVLNLGEGDTDVQRAGRLLQLGTQAADASEAVQWLGEALALWRGLPLADVTGIAWLEEQAERLDVLRLQVQRALFEAKLAVGEHAQLVPGLEQMLAEHPLDEQLYAQLMVALYRAGRQADALAVYHRLRHTLGEELGIDPSQRLREVETAILRQDPSLDAPGPASLAVTPVVTSASALPAMPVAAQLPPAATGFVGRGAELATLDALLQGTAEMGPAGPGAVVISAISGTAGVGKTALAVHWAHKVAAQFPDGQLHVNLRGFDPARPPLDPAEAVRGFLDAFGVAVERIPDGLAAQAALYRSLLAGKQVLVVLDNAHDTDQVRPLLPGSPGCLAIVTSRNYLTGLVAADGACPLLLELLTTAEARDLLTGRLGKARVAHDPDAASEIIKRCARLPLALAIVAARAAASPGFPLAVAAAELRQAKRALDPLNGGDTATDARAVFSWSYHALSPDARRLFRLLGLHPGPDITIAAAASLAAAPLDRTRVLLAELTRANVLSEHVPGRYASHDLLRAYASELAHAHDSGQDRDAAVLRVIEHCLHTAHSAAMLMEPFLYPIVMGAPRCGVIVTELTTDDDALAWFTAEQATLLAAVHRAAGTGSGTYCWQLGLALTAFLLRRGLWHDQARACQAGLAAARRSGDRTGEAHSLLGLALGRARSGRILDAYPLFQDALRRFGEIGDHTKQAVAHAGLCWIAERQHRYADMLTHALRRLDLYRLAGNRLGQAVALNDIGYSHALLGNYQSALTYCEQALAAALELRERNYESAVWHSLGLIHHRLGNYQRALACYQRAGDLSQELGDLFNEADTLSSLGDVHHSAGDTDAARQAWARALSIFDEIGHPDGDQLRTKLH